MTDRIWIAAVALLMAALPLSAQNGAYNGYSPYSVYGVGDLHAAGTAYNASMGGVGIATRNKRFVNTMNPASATARDSLSFMADFGLSGKFSLFQEGDLKGAKTLFNINNFVISFPMWRHTAFMVGIQPFSDTGFSMSYIDKITTGDQSIGYTGNRAYGAYGDGGLNQFFAGASALLWNRLSIGAQYNLYFGTISKYSMSQFSDASYRSQTLGDTLQVRAHTAKFGLQYEQPIGTGKFSLVTDGDLKGTKTLFNINDFVISFPMWRRTAFMVGIQPFSDTGFSMSYIDKITSGEQSIGYTGNRAYGAAGDGGLNQFFAGASALLWNRLSVGVQYNLYFGTISKYSQSQFSDASYRTQTLGDTLQVRAHTAKFGLQYEQPVGTGKLVVGATYRLKARATGHAIEYSNVAELDLGSHELEKDNIWLGDEIGAGLAYNQGDKWSFEVDYLRSDWSHSNFDAVRGFRNNGVHSFSTSVAQSVKAGFEITPNRNDIRYYLRRCTYRLGAYMDQSYYQVDGKNLMSAGITLGMTLPVFQGYNGMTFALDLGQRGFGSGFVKENYLGFHVGFNIFDIWFRKPQYQ